MKKYLGKNRIIAVGLMVALTVVALFCAWFLPHEYEHARCCKKECPVCCAVEGISSLHLVESILITTVLGFVIVAAVFFNSIKIKERTHVDVNGDTYYHIEESEVVVNG